MVLLVALVACQTQHGGIETEVACEVGQACRRDPEPHCVRSSGFCRDSGECPSGLTCELSQGGGLTCDAPGLTVITQQCMWRPREVDPIALRNGFDVSRKLEISVETAPELAINWVAPSSATFVTCAIFTCDPVFRHRPDGATTPTGEPIRDIQNINACTYRTFVHRAEFGSARLSSTSGRPPEREECFSLDDPLRPTFENLSVGCWAYGDATIIAASDLVPVDPAVIATSTPAFPGDAACEVDDRQCYDPVRRYFGMCVGGACQPRCALGRPNDCHVAGVRYFGDPDDTVCRWECAPVDDSLVGVCKPL